MKMILTSLAAVSAFAVAAPAAAQSYGYQQNGYGNQSWGGQGYGTGASANTMSSRIQQLRMRLQAGAQAGSIPRREAARLDRKIRHLSALEQRFSRNGISRQERAELRQRMQNIRQEIRQADRYNQARWDDYDRQDGYGRYDRDDDYGQYGQYPQGGQYGQYPQNQYPQNQYPQNGQYGQYPQNGQYGGGYQQPAQSGGIGGLLQGLLGVGGNAGLRVGQRATGNLGAVPYQYQGQFRDGNGSYFRSDGRFIYQIDARTQTVVQVYSIGR